MQPFDPSELLIREKVYVEEYCMSRSKAVQIEVDPSAQPNIEFNMSCQTISMPVGQNVNANNFFFPIQT